MSVKNSSNLISSLIKNPSSLNTNKQDTQTVIYLKNFGNLSGGIVKKKLATPSRSVRSTSGVVGSVGSFRRGIPANENNFFSNGDEKNNQTLLFSNNKSSINNNSFLFSSNNTPAISKNKNNVVQRNNNIFTNTTSASTGNNIFNNTS